MCDFMPPTADPPENYHVDNHQRTVGQIVSVFCKNATVAIVKCMPDLKWNATVPACAMRETSENMGGILIIVWVTGGVLLFALVILIIIIVSTRSKTSCSFRGVSSPSTSVFHISGIGHRARRPGGDNPAFSRADERCGEWSFHRAPMERLPSYHEAILNNYITVPARAGQTNQQEPQTFVRINAPPSYRSSQLPVSISQTEPQGTITAGSPCTNERSNSVTNEMTEEWNDRNNEITEDQNPGTSHRNAEPDSVSSARTEADAADASSNQRSAETESENAPISRRYAENYPQCFFEDDPPPPYSSDLSNYQIYRSSARQNHQSSRGYNPVWRRSMHSVPSSNTNQRQNELQQNLSFRRSMYDRTANTNPVSFSSNTGPHASSHVSDETTSAADAYTNQNDTGYNTRINSEAHHPMSSTSHLSSDACNAYCTSSNGSHGSTLSTSSGNYTSSHTTVPAHGMPRSSHSPYTIRASDSAEPSSVTPPSSYLSIGGASNRSISDSNRNYGPVNQKMLYVVKNSYATPSTPPLFFKFSSLNSSPHPPYMDTCSSSHPLYMDAHPLCTSTPISQSPATDRKFVPVNHPSPLPIGHNRHIQEQLILHSLRSELEGHDSHKVGQGQTTLPVYLPQVGQPYSSCLTHSRQGSAPIARLDSEFL